MFQSCGLHSDLYRNTEDKTPVTNKNLDEYSSIYALANAGAYAKGSNEELLYSLKDYVSARSKEDDFLIFVGDNVHDNDLTNTRNKRQLQQQLQVSTDFKGTTLFIPGELDWNEEGIEGLESIEESIESFYKEEDHFLPKNGCPLEFIDVDATTELVLINSQWYVEDWNKFKGFNDKCEIKTRTQFKAILADGLRKARHKTIIIAMHHPLYTNGVYGGEIPAEVVYRPTAENAFIPGAGIAWAFLRSQGGLSKQDRYNPLMNELMSAIELALLEAPRAIILSGHERVMQYIDHDNIKQVIAGTASSVKPGRLSKRGQFSSSKAGFSEIRRYKDGSSSVHFFELSNGTFKELYNTQAFSKPKAYNIDSLPTTFPKTMKASVYPPESVVKSKKYVTSWGAHYRYTYGIEVEAPVAILDTLYGGLTVERAGGGNQTMGLRLVSKDDREYNMRAIAKDPIAFLKSSGYNDLDADDYFEGTVPATVIEDFYTAAHPYGAFAIPLLAEAIELNHTHPKLYYVPKQKALGNFNSTHGNRLYMIVEKPDEDFDKSHMFNYSKEVESTSDLFKELRENEKLQLDERSYIRARIFDMLIGDWDRHEDQWRWAQDKVDEEKGITKYIAVPRDRDQVFANFDGKILETTQKVMSGARQFGKYGPDIPHIKQFSQSAINLDRALVQRSDKSVWLEEVAYIQQHITPEIVAHAFRQAPIEIQDSVWMGIQEDLLSRKRNLPDIVSRFYDDFATFQSLKGTDKEDYFSIENTVEGDVHVIAYRMKDGVKETLLFDRTFYATETKHLWIYGLDDQDIFDVKGINVSPINIVISGGLENDTYTIEGGKNIAVFDQKSYKNTIIKKGKANFHIDDIYENHIYNSEHKPDSKAAFGLETTYNPDDGITPRIQYSSMKMGFERNPFTSKIELDARYFSLTQAADVNLSWHRSHLFQDWNFKAFGRATTANYTQNFFDLGNKSTNIASTFDANRVGLQYLTAGIGTYYQGEYGTAAEVDILYENIDLANASTNVPLLSDASYLTIAGKYEYKSVDDERFVTRGMNFKLHTAFSDELTRTNIIGILDPAITFWNAIDRSRKLVFKTKVTGQLRFGDEIPFYKLATIGADSGLRSYRQGRFRGQQALTGLLDIAYKFKPIKTPLFPIRLQGHVGFDTGRVWITQEQNNTFHYSYGGGIQVTTAAVFKAKLSYFNGPEGGRLGFGFFIGM
ncbi:metallophosphoesterase [Dokdonia ponticola]|uniref:Metallophosphoesterase n=1 Tax=Dokdonia ponticola TaxID=2041041 RepID=A0ABV9HZF9_9FLAO